ncbi:MAG: Ig-like domain-containing protein [Steroidobacteraceae bacterium]
MDLRLCGIAGGRRSSSALLLLFLGACGGGGDSNISNSFSVSGSITGLSGTGLTVQLNNGNDLLATGNGSFKFSTQLGNGSTYAVTVKSQPASPTQRCAVNNGNGVINGSNASNVAIICVDVMTLATSSPANGEVNVDRETTFVLNFSADLDSRTIIPANLSLTSTSGNQPSSLQTIYKQARITPLQKLLPLTTYTINANANIIGLKSEILLNPQTVSFKTRDAVWNVQTNVTGVSTGSGSPQIVMHSDGSALAVWYGYNGVESNIYSSSYTRQSGWSTPIALDSNPEPAYEPRIAMDNMGNAIAIWYQTSSTAVRNDIWAARYTATGGWSAPTSIQSPASGTAYQPKIAMDSNGNAIAAWWQYDGYSYNIYAARYRTDGGWDAATLIENNGSGFAYKPEVAMSAAGDALVVWYQGFGSATRILTNHFSPGQGWSGVEFLRSASYANSYVSDESVKVAMNADGTGVAAWSRGDGINGLETIWTSRYSPTSGWTTPISITGAADDDGGAPAVSIDSKGNALAIWPKYLSPGYGLVASYYDVTSGWSSPQLLQSNSDQIWAPQVVFDSSGNALAIWAQAEVSSSTLWSGRYASGEGWSSAQKIGGYAVGAVNNPAINICKNGDAIAIWSQSNSANNGILTNRFE